MEVDYSKLGLSTIETEILHQYQLLSKQLHELDNEIQNITLGVNRENDGVSEEMLRNMRDLEKKLAVVYEIFKSSIYSLITYSDE
ncbi:DASH complex subunit Dad3p [[Candida] jaroonii]|uniref:DASH complex subunit Dad3p n=1 Tax=[Candida] jaroonii TaxID=467808 RepID=A0ACA9Y1W2_9ASCO|nr:DASH complex subunit Dad3p [[Candida] jaroonii]